MPEISKPTSSLCVHVFFPSAPSERASEQAGPSRQKIFLQITPHQHSLHMELLLASIDQPLVTGLQHRSAAYCTADRPWAPLSRRGECMPRPVNRLQRSFPATSAPRQNVRAHICMQQQQQQQLTRSLTPVSVRVEYAYTGTSTTTILALPCTSCARHSGATQSVSSRRPSIDGRRQARMPVVLLAPDPAFGQAITSPRVRLRGGEERRGGGAHATWFGLARESTFFSRGETGEWRVEMGTDDGWVCGVCACARRRGAWRAVRHVADHGKSRRLTRHGMHGALTSSSCFHSTGQLCGTSTHHLLYDWQRIKGKSTEHSLLLIIDE